jgi:DNA-binding PadR family transcriptional regulator
VKGLVTSELETAPPPHVKEGNFYIPRRMYQLTPRGRDALAATKSMLGQYHDFLLGS